LYLLRHQLRSKISPDWVNVSHGIGLPLGGLGNGYSVFGKYGFVKLNFNGKPDDFKYKPFAKGEWSYLDQPQQTADYGFIVTSGKNDYVLQKSKASWYPSAQPFDTVSAFAYLPKGLLTYEKSNLPFKVAVSTFTPLVPHNLKVASTPVQVFDIEIENTTDAQKNYTLKLYKEQPGKNSSNKVVFADNEGEIAFGATNSVGSVHGLNVNITVATHAKKTTRFYISWYYRRFDQRLPEPAIRYYTKYFKNASDVLDEAFKQSDHWLNEIDRWHASLDVPAYFKRLWFSSLCSVMTSTMLSDRPRFYEIETPHGFLNTMDVDVYSSWIYLINWPELEKISMEMYNEAIPKEGNKAGFVWHSLWNDATHYVEEPIFMVRLYRDHLWFNDKKWVADGFANAINSANRVYREESYQYLINSNDGNQSYDLWKMPGVNTFVNSAWLFGLHGMENLSSELNKEVLIGQIPVKQLRQRASASYDSLLWNDKVNDWNCFFRTATANKGGNPQSVFSDQLFGKWALAIDKSANDVLPPAKVESALITIYTNNLVVDQRKHFKGWSNGMLPNRKIDTSGLHAYMFWFGAQINLGSLLGMIGEEQKSLEVFQAVEYSLQNNHLAAGEWNQSLNGQLRVQLLAKEPGKDSPRFPPYPRYKSC
jgi:uncharacterized protein (DUF608 family)